LDALDSIGLSDEAQAQRWVFALLELSSRHLRDYLKRLPTFEDMPAEERALDLVAEHDDLEEALWFLLHWPEPHRAARLVLATPKPLNGDRYFLLAPLAELLEKRQPLAATVCLRAMIDFTLEVARSKRYIHAARHLETCHRLAAAINDWGMLADHRKYMAQLRRDHGRKYGFWGDVPKKIIPEAETGAKVMDKGVVEKGGKGRVLRGPGDADGEAGSVQPGLW
jgi:hypothetical protein